MIDVAQSSGNRILDEAVEVHLGMGAGASAKIKYGPAAVEAGAKLISVNYDYKGGEWEFYPVAGEAGLSAEIDNTPFMIGGKIRNIEDSRYNNARVEKEFGLGVKLFDIGTEKPSVDANMNLGDMLEDISVSIGGEIYLGPGVEAEASVKPGKIAKILVEEILKQRE